MSNTIKEGGLAFPAITIRPAYDPAYNAPTSVYHPGMSMRDWLAGMVVNGLASSDGWNSNFTANPEKASLLNSVVETAYAAADAMIAARNKTQ